MGRLLVVAVVLAAAFTAEAQQPRQPTLGYLSNSDGHSASDSAFLGCPLRYGGRSRAPSCNYVDLTLDEIGNELGETVGLPG
jgi:hypothetical protein